MKIKPKKRAEENWIKQGFWDNKGGNMYKIKNRMCKNDWTEGDDNNDMKKFLTVECKIEDPVALNNPTCSIQLSLDELSFKERIKIMTDILEENLKDKEFFFCEYGSVGMCYKQKYIKGHYNKENCIEFDTFYPGEGGVILIKI